MRAFIILLLASLCFFQCSMFEDIEMYSGKDIGDIGVDIYLGTSPTIQLFISKDKGKSFSQIPTVEESAVIQLWAVNNNNELLTVELIYSSYNIYSRKMDMQPSPKGFFGGSDSVNALTAGPNGEFYLCANVSSVQWLYILTPGAASIMPVVQLSSISGTITNIWAIPESGGASLYILADSSLHYSSDGGKSFLNVSIATTSVTDMVKFNNKIYLSTGEATYSIYYSLDRVNFFQISGSPLSCFALHSTRDKLYAPDGSNYSLSFSFDGDTWLGGFTGYTINDIGSDYTGRIYMATTSGLYASDDGGISGYYVNLFTGSKLAVVSYKK